MALIDMLTNISSFDYGKVGKQNLDSEEGNYTTNRNTKDSTEYQGVSEVTFDGTGINFPNVNYTPLASAREGSEGSSINLSGPIDVKKNLTTKPNVPIQLYDNPYGALPIFTPLEDRLGDVDDEYKKFGGFRGSRASQPGNPGNANPETFGADSPYILKEIGDSDITISPASDGVTDIVFRAARAVTDVVRIGKWTLTPKGIIWNLNQFLLTTQNAISSNRVFNPAGTLGSLIPYVHLPRHTDGTFFDFVSPPSYDTKFDGKNITLAQPEEESDSSSPLGFLKKVGNFFGIGDGLETNRLEHLLNTRVISPQEESSAASFVSGLKNQLGLGNDYFINPPHYNKSTKGPYGRDLNLRTQNGKSKAETQPQLIEDYSSRKLFNTRFFGQSKLTNIDRSLTNIERIDEEGNLTKIDPKNNPIVSTELTPNKPNLNGVVAKDYNLGSGMISKGDTIYSVGVSNQLQIPYHGKFGDLNTDQLPKDFIKFRIRDAVNGKWLIFPAHLGQITDTITPEYTKEAYIGRPDEVHIYSKTTRTVGFDFKVIAFTKQEIPIIQEKMNYLVGLGYPTFKPIIAGDVEERPVTPYIYLTIGDLFNNTPGYFDNITVSTEENANWEIDEGFQVPMLFSVSVNFVYIGKYLPTTLGKHYDVPWLNDNGAGTGTFSSDPRDGVTNKPDRQGDVGWTAEMPSYTQ